MDYIEKLRMMVQQDIEAGKYCVDEESEIIDLDDDDEYEVDSLFNVEEIDDFDNEYTEENEFIESFNKKDDGVIDMNYVPTEIEAEMLGIELPKETFNNISIFDIEDDTDISFDFSSMKKNKENHSKNQERKKANEKVDDKIAKNIAKRIINEPVSFDDDSTKNEDWLRDDMFGNDISKLLVEEKPANDEVKYEKGSFSDWASQ